MSDTILYPQSKQKGPTGPAGATGAKRKAVCAMCRGKISEYIVSIVV